MDVAIRAIRGSEKLPGTARIYLPGEQSHKKFLDRSANGIPIGQPLRDSLDAVARELGVALLN